MNGRSLIELCLIEYLITQIDTVDRCKQSLNITYSNFSPIFGLYAVSHMISNHGNKLH